MPKIDGFEVLALTRKETDLKGIPIIVITTSDYPDNIQRCKALTCAGYVIKPLKPDFIDTLEQVAARYFDP
jgi:CheY-like chemotaxis protein